MCKFNTISLDAADTLFFIKKGLGNTYYEILKKYTDKFKPKEISDCFKKYFNSRHGLYFSGLQGPELESAEKDWWYRLVKDIFDDLGMFDSFDDYFNELYKHFEFDAWEIYDDTIPFLQELKGRGFKIIITSNFDSRIFKVCDGFGISPYINHFTISSQSGCAKPDKDFFLKSLYDSGSDIKTTVHIGDNPELDYKACNRIGLKAFLIDRDEKINGDYVINSLSSVLRKI